MLFSRSLGALAALALTAVLAGCGLGGDDSAEGDTSAAKRPGPLGTAQILAKVAPSTVAINTSVGKLFHSHGTGVVVDADRGLVLTSTHLIEDAASIKVIVGEKTQLQGRPVARATCDDIALLALTPKPADLVPIEVGASKEVQAGEDVMALGYAGVPQPQGVLEKISITRGTVAASGAPGKLHPALPTFDALILHQAPLVKGNTGGPLVNRNGELVGLNTVIQSKESSVPAGLYAAVASDRVQELRSELKPDDDNFFRGWEPHHKCDRQLGQLAKAHRVVNHDLVGHELRRAERENQVTE